MLLPRRYGIYRTRTGPAAIPLAMSDLTYVRLRWSARSDSCADDRAARNAIPMPIGRTVDRAAAEWIAARLCHSSLPLTPARCQRGLYDCSDATIESNSCKPQRRARQADGVS